MKNKIIIAILAFTSFACSVQTNNNQVKPSTSITTNPTEIKKSFLPVTRISKLKKIKRVNYLL